GSGLRKRLMRRLGRQRSVGGGLTMNLSPEKRSVRLWLDASELVAALAALSTEIPQLPLEIVERALGICDAPLEAVAFEIDPDAAAAGVVGIRLQPSDRFRGLMAASGARNINRLIVEDAGHGKTDLSGREP